MPFIFSIIIGIVISKQFGASAIPFAIAYLIPAFIYTKLTDTEGWYTENWSTFFKRLIQGKLYNKDFNSTDDRQPY